MIGDIIIVICIACAYYFYNKQKKAKEEKEQLITSLKVTETPIFEFLYMQARSGNWPFISPPQYMQDIYAGFNINIDTRSTVFLLRLCTVDRKPLNNEDAQHLGTVIQADLNWAVSHGELIYSPKVLSVYNERGSVFVRIGVSI
ncbi:hypothetical protein [Lacrimispora indolis]|uniref:hypothetical protein n=1 Tax=Lacrimispora indolis TaxID=69825 RepID=UPI00041825CB|nr:hypothetical protein [[Clostridium] methoxybenzovorans]